ncbi:hypothetical protein MPER_04474, partial [Moniliophthora perniciosa FA553]
ARMLMELSSVGRMKQAYVIICWEPDAFPGSLWLMSQRACVFFHMHEFSQAERQFERILAMDPQRIENIDIFSNILDRPEEIITLSVANMQKLSNISVERG